MTPRHCLTCVTPLLDVKRLAQFAFANLGGGTERPSQALIEETAKVVWREIRGFCSTDCEPARALQ